MTKAERIEETIEYLRGTCNSLLQAADAFGLDEYDEELCAALDAEIFLCTQCNWWCEIHEEVSDEAGLGERTCSQCADE